MSIVSLIGPLSTRGAEEVWLGATGNFSDSTKWLDGSAPQPGGDLSLALRFSGKVGAFYTATNDLGSPFVVNKLLLNNDGIATITSPAPGVIELAAANPVIAILGIGDTRLQSALQLNPSEGDTSIVSQGFGTLSLSNISEFGGSRRLIVSAATPFQGSQVTLSGTNTFSGGLLLQSGRLSLASGAALGSGTFVVDGGEVNAGAAQVNIGSAVTLNADLRTYGAGNLIFAPGSALTGSGGINARGSESIRIQTPATYAGETLIGFDSPAVAGRVTLEGAQGSALTTAGFSVNTGTLLLDNTLLFTGGATGRVADETPIRLRAGTIELRGNSSAETVETVGMIIGGGFSTIVVSPTAATSTRLISGALNRSERGTFLVQSSRLGASAGPGVGNVIFTSAPGGLAGGGGAATSASILPYVIGDSDTVAGGEGFVTYDPTSGIRLLDPATEYAASVNGASADSNVRVALGDNVNSDVTVNSLVTARSDASALITGTGTLRIASGALLNAGRGADIRSAIDFGNAEANIFAAGTAASTISLSGAISGSGGLTKSGPNKVILTGANTFTGPLTINSGLLFFSTQASLGTDISPIVVNGGLGAGLSSGGNLTRDIQVNSGVLNLEARPGNFTVGGTITGDGAVRILPGSNTATVIFRNPNSYTGATTIHGILAITSDAALGNAEAPLFLSADAPGVGLPTLILNGAWSTNRAVTIIRNSLNSASKVALNTNGFDAILHGVVIGSVATDLDKSGAGVLTIEAASPYSGGLNVVEGVVRLSGNGEIRSRTIIVGAAGRLLLDNTSIADSDRLADNANITVGGEGLTLTGNVNAPITEAVSALVGSASVPTIISLTTPGVFPTRLSAATYSGGTGRRVLFRGTALGTSSVGAFTRVTFSTAPLLAAGLLRGAIVETDAAGWGNSFATYDTATDEAGVIGVRPLRTGEYITGAIIRNPANGGTTPVNANYLVDGAGSLIGATNTVNSLTLAGNASLVLGAGQTLNLGTETGIMTQRGANASVLGGTIAVTLGTALQLQGDGNLILGSVLTASDVYKSGTGTLTANGTRHLGAMNISNGKLQLDAGSQLSDLEIGPAGSLELTGARAQITSLSGSGHVDLGQAILTVRGGSTLGAYYGTLSGAGGFVVGNGARLSLGGFADYTGPTKVGRMPDRPDYLSFLPTLELFKEGAALSSNSYEAFGGGMLALANSFYAASSDRIGDAPVKLNGGIFEMRGDSVLASSEAAGRLIGTGYSTVRVQPDATGGLQGAPTALKFAALERVDRGTFGVALGSSSVFPNPNAALRFDSQLNGFLIGAGTTSTNRGIIPFAVMTIPEQIATYDGPVGIRALDPLTEMSEQLGDGANAWIRNPAFLGTNVSVNALHLQGRLEGAGVLTVASGLILGGGTISTPVAFNGVEGCVWAKSDQSLLLTGPISGTNGLTVTGLSPTARVVFGGANTFTGSLTVNAGILAFSSVGNLGPDTNAIAVNDATLEYVGPPLVLDRGIRITGYQVRLNTSGGQLTVRHEISGVGSVYIQGDIALLGTNTYAGFTEVAGKLTINSDAALGTGTFLQLSTNQLDGRSGILALAGPWVTSRAVNIRGAYAGTIDTGGFDAILNGAFSAQSFSNFRKIGAGTLRLNGDGSSFSGEAAVEAGTLAVNGIFAPTQGVRVATGGTLSGAGRIQSFVSFTGTVAPGDPVGPLATGSFYSGAGSTLLFELESPQDYDQVNVTGTIDLSLPAQLALSLFYDPEDNVDAFTILLNDDADAVIGTTRLTLAGAPLTEGSTFFVNGQAFRITYHGGTGNDVVLQAIPEPAATALLALTSGVVLLRRRRA